MPNETLVMRAVLVLILIVLGVIAVMQGGVHIHHSADQCVMVAASDGRGMPSCGTQM